MWGCRVGELAENRAQYPETKGMGCGVGELAENRAQYPETRGWGVGWRSW